MMNLQIDVSIDGFENIKEITAEIEETQKKLESLSKELAKAVRNMGYTISTSHQE